MSNKKEIIRIAVFGDSISEGIGSRKINYCDYLRELLRNYYNIVIIDNYAHTGTTISYIEDIKEHWYDNRYDVVIIAYGNVDAMLRPDLNHSPNLYALLPSRYKQNGMLNPRPYYSKRWYKSIGQHFDSWFRWHLNKFLLTFQGATTWVSEAEFKRKYSNSLEDFKRVSENFILLSTVHVSDRYFPGTNSSYMKYNEIIKYLSQQFHTVYVDLYNLNFPNNEFYDDVFHPNEEGYKRIATIICEEIKQIR